MKKRARIDGHLSDSDFLWAVHFGTVKVGTDQGGFDFEQIKRLGFDEEKSAN